MEDKVWKSVMALIKAPPMLYLYIKHQCLRSLQHCSSFCVLCSQECVWAARSSLDFKWSVCMSTECCHNRNTEGVTFDPREEEEARKGSSWQDLSFNGPSLESFLVSLNRCHVFFRYLRVCAFVCSRMKSLWVILRWSFLFKVRGNTFCPKKEKQVDPLQLRLCFLMFTFVQIYFDFSSSTCIDDSFPASSQAFYS